VGFRNFLFKVSEVTLQHFVIRIHTDDFFWCEILGFDDMGEFLLLGFYLLEFGV
jgi:hypothetical protein